jgi:hypothetical protein
MTKLEKIKLIIESAQGGFNIEESFINLITTLPDNEIPVLKKLKERYLNNLDELFKESREALVAMYDKFLSEEAIDAAIAFFATPEGAQFLAAMPKINDALTEHSSKYTMLLTQKVLQDLFDAELSEDDLKRLGIVKIGTGPLGTVGDTIPPELIDLLMGTINDAVNSTEPEEPKQRPIKVDNSDEVTEDDFAKFAEKWLKQDPEKE